MFKVLRTFQSVLVFRDRPAFRHLQEGCKLCLAFSASNEIFGEQARGF